jgi:hypothetical protein
MTALMVEGLYGTSAVGPKERFGLSALAPLSGEKRTIGLGIKNDAIDPSATWELNRQIQGRRAAILVVPMSPVFLLLTEMSSMFGHRIEIGIRLSSR